MSGSLGVTAIEAKTAGVTVRVVVALKPPSVAVMVDEPVARVDATPPLEIVATLVSADAHRTEDVMFAVEPSV